MQTSTSEKAWDVDRTTHGQGIAINAAFLQEIKEVNQDLWKCLAEVGQLCDTVVWDDATCRQLTDRIDELLDHLALHFSLEEAYGYFDGPVVTGPRKSMQAKSLRDEHRQLYVELQDIDTTVGELFRHGKLAEASPRVKARLRTFHDQLIDHESRENELIVEAVYEESGVGD